MSKYTRIIEEIFRSKFENGMVRVEFERQDISEASARLGIDLPRNLGDVIYTFRYRQSMPESIQNTAGEGQEWTIKGRGKSSYFFHLGTIARVSPNPQIATTKVPNATPGIIAMYALGDEQALLAKVRYNRLIDIFTGITCYSLQNHLRTSVEGIGQIETDEIYVGVDTKGSQYVIPVQAKGGNDTLSLVQIEQDFSLCNSKFSTLICIPVAAQFMSDDVIALFAFEKSDGIVSVSTERHYRLVDPSDVSLEDLELYRQRL